MKTDVGRRAGPLLVFCMNSKPALSRTPTTMLSRANMPPHPMFQKQKPSLGWMPSRRNATGSCMQRSAKTCGKPLNLSCRQERDVRSSVSMMVSAPYCVLKSLYAGKRATERERKRTNVCCCCAKERVSVFWKRLMKTYPINPYYSECAWVPALARRPGLLRTRFALKPCSCVCEMYVLLGIICILPHPCVCVHAVCILSIGR